MDPHPATTPTDPDRFVALPDAATLAQTISALQERGFSVETVDDLDSARAAVLARIPEHSLVMTNQSVTLEQTGIAHAIDASARYESARSKVLALDRATQMQEIRRIMLLADFSLGSVHAITRDGTLAIASGTGSQLSAYAWAAANVILVVGAQKLVPDLQTAHDRIHQHCLPLEDARALEAYGMHSQVGKILQINRDLPGRIHIVIIRAAVGF